MTTSTELFQQVSSSTGQLVESSLPLIYLFIGIVVVAFAFTQVVKAVKYLGR